MLPASRSGAIGRGRRLPRRPRRAGAARPAAARLPRRRTPAGTRWRRGWPQAHTVVAPDLRGYGASRAARRAAGRGLQQARDGGRARRADGGARPRALRGRRARPGRPCGVPARARPSRPRQRVAVVNTVPTLEQFERMGAGPSLGFWPWFLLAQPRPSRSGCSPRARTWCSTSCSRRGRRIRSHPARGADRVPGTRARRATWRRCAPTTGRASTSTGHDAEDREAGRLHRRAAAARHGRGGGPARRRADVWRAWADDVTAVRVPGGHFLPEEAPDALAAALGTFLRAA